MSPPSPASARQLRDPWVPCAQARRHRGGRGHGPALRRWWCGPRLEGLVRARSGPLKLAPSRAGPWRPVLARADSARTGPQGPRRAGLVLLEPRRAALARLPHVSRIARHLLEPIDCGEPPKRSRSPAGSMPPAGRPRCPRPRRQDSTSALPRAVLPLRELDGPAARPHAARSPSARVSVGRLADPAVPLLSRHAGRHRPAGGGGRSPTRSCRRARVPQRWVQSSITTHLVWADLPLEGLAGPLSSAPQAGDASASALRWDISTARRRQGSLSGPGGRPARRSSASLSVEGAMVSSRRCLRLGLPKRSCMS